MNTLTLHVQAVHDGVKPAFKCQVCGFSCHRKAQLERHMFEHDGDPFKCDLCQFSTKYKATIINHIKTHGPKNLVCEFCDYATHSGLFSQNSLYVRFSGLGTVSQSFAELFRNKNLKRIIAQKSHYTTPYSSKRIQM